MVTWRCGTVTPAATTIFSDISDHWAEGKIIATVETGVFTGTSESIFSPALPVIIGRFLAE